MELKTFELKVSVTYAANNEMDEVVLEKKNDDGVYEHVPVHEKTPGLLVYIYSILTCQHLFLKMNASEKNMQLTKTVGEIFYEMSVPDFKQQTITTNWVCESEDNADEEVVDFFVKRMNACPVSSNLCPVNPKETTLEFNGITITQ